MLTTPSNLQLIVDVDDVDERGSVEASDLN